MRKNRGVSQNGKIHRWISRRLQKDHTVIDREINRNSGDYFPYKAATAQRICEQGKVKTNQRKLEQYQNQDLREYVISQLRQDISPKQIAGRVQKRLVPDINKTIHHESIYQYIYEGEGRFEYLYPHLRTGRSKRQRKYSRKNAKNQLLKKESPEFWIYLINTTA